MVNIKRACILAGLMFVLSGYRPGFTQENPSTAVSPERTKRVEGVTRALDVFQSQNIYVPSDKVQPAVLPETPLPQAQLSSPAPEKNKANPIILDVLELKDMDISDVLKIIAQKSGLNIVAGQNVAAKVTIYLKDVDVRDALKIILESNNLAYLEEGGIIRVLTAPDYEARVGYRFGEKIETKMAPLTHAHAAEVIALLNQLKSPAGKVIADEKSNTLILMDVAPKIAAMEALLKGIDVPIATEVFHLSYAKAEDIAAKISETMTPNVGRVKSDVRSNKIMVTDTPQKMKEVRSLVKAFDEKEREVLIEAKIIQIVLSDEHRMGVDWEAIVSDYHSLRLTGKLNALNSPDKAGRLSIGTVSADDYSVLLEALETVGKTNILSSPRITTLNNKEAKILVGSTEPYVTTTTTTPSSGPSTTAESVNFIEVGVKLYVTPTIHNDDFITMKIRPEVSSVVRTILTSNNNVIPVVETSEAETTVMVKDKVTIVIGGLIKEEKIETMRKIPLLGDLPFLGFVFRSEGEIKRKTEIVIFLTPKIISGSLEAASASRLPEEDYDKTAGHINSETRGAF